MKLLGLDHIGIVVRDIDQTVARAGEAVDGRAVGERFVADDIDLQVLRCGESILELIEVRAAGFGMPKLEGGETAVIGHFGIEVDDLEDTKAELTRRGVVLQGEVETDEVHFIFTAPQTTFGAENRTEPPGGIRQPVVRSGRRIGGGSLPECRSCSSSSVRSVDRQDARRVVCRRRTGRG